MDLGHAEWRTSSYTADHTECVEIAYVTQLPTVGIRDSKNPEGGHLTLPANALSQLVASYS
jgi:hypothetical protein